MQAFRLLPTITIPYIPPLVDLADLDSDNLLLTKEQITLVKEQLKAKENGRYKKSDLGLNYDIIKIKNEFYAVYKGGKKGKILGSGGFGKTKLVQNIKTGEWAALKIIYKEQSAQIKTQEKHKHKPKKSQESTVKKIIERKDSKETVEANEEILLKKLKQLLISYHRKNNKNQYQNEIVMEFFQGETLFDLANPYRLFAPIVYFNLILKLLEITAYLIDNRILHRDIKPENILADIIEYKVELVDWGLAKFMDKGQSFYRGGRNVGTPLYMAPEVAAESTNDNSMESLVNYNEKTEIRSVGVTVGNLLGLALGKGNTFVDVEDEENRNHYASEKVANIHVLKEIIDFLNSTVNLVQNERPTTKEALNKFSVLFATKLNTLSKIVKYGFINFSHFCSASSKEKEAIFNAAKEMDQIIFCDNRGTPRNPYAYAQREFYDRKIYVSSTVIQYASQNQHDLPAAISDFLQHNKSKLPQINIGYFFRDQENIENLDFQYKLNEYGVYSLPYKKKFNPEFVSREMGLPVDDKVFTKAIDSLKDEISRLKEKNTNSFNQTRQQRVESLTKSLNFLENNKMQSGVIRYGQLANLLMLLIKTIKLSGHKSTNQTYKTVSSLLDSSYKKADDASDQEFELKVECTPSSNQLLTAAPKPSFWNEKEKSSAQPDQNDFSNETFSNAF